MVALTTVVVAAIGACSSGPELELDVDLSPSGERGRAIVADAGCDSCHGSIGQGGVGPAWAGLFNSTVMLESGEVVTADAEYLTRSIMDPGADQVAGFTVQMPSNTLTNSEIDAVVTYIQELG